MKSKLWQKKEKMKPVYGCVRFLVRWLLRFFYSMEEKGLEHPYKGGAIIASNHVSFLDPEVLSTCWPQEVHFLARASLFKNFFFGKLISTLNTHPVGSLGKDVKTLKLICGLLKSGKKVIMFPEGTRSKTNEFGEIKPGVSLIALTANVPIIPAYIKGSYEIWGRDRKRPKLTGKLICSFGAPIFCNDVQDKDRKEAQQIISERLREAILKLKEAT